jgi:hypothetical protein
VQIEWLYDGWCPNLTRLPPCGKFHPRCATNGQSTRKTAVENRMWSDLTAGACGDKLYARCAEDGRTGVKLLGGLKKS